MRGLRLVGVAVAGAVALGACSSSAHEIDHADKLPTTTSLGPAANQVPFVVRVGDTEALGERWKIQVTDATVTDTHVAATVVLINGGTDAASLAGIDKAFTFRHKFIGNDDPAPVTGVPISTQVAANATLTVKIAFATTFAKGDLAILYFHGKPYGAHDATVDLRTHV